MVWSAVLFIATIILAAFAYGSMPGVASTSLALVTWMFFLAFVVSFALIGWQHPAQK